VIIMSGIFSHFFKLRFLSWAGALFLLIGMSVSAHAAGLLKVEQMIFGMDCAPCAYGIQQGVMALAGVKQATVNLNTGRATIVLAPDNPTTLAQIQTVILKHGFTPKGAVITAAGRIVKEGSEYYLNLGNNVRFQLMIQSGKPTPSFPAAQNVIVSGEVAAPPAGKTASSALTVESLKPATA
jgi:cation transport ATPase